MVGPAKFNAMRGKALRELRSFVKRNAKQVAKNVETAETEDDSVLLTYLNRGINFPRSDNDELSIYMKEIAIVTKLRLRIMLPVILAIGSTIKKYTQYSAH